MAESVFTKIISGELPAHRLYEDDKCIVILDIHPVQPGHALVITKKQVEYIWDIDNDLYEHIWAIAKEIALHQRQVLGTKRVSVIVDGEAVPHAHIQLIPTNKADDLHAKPPAEPDHEALREIASKLRLET